MILSPGCRAPRYIFFAAILAICLIVWLPAPYAVRLVAAALLVFFLPGWALLQLARPRLDDLLERLLLSAGLSCGLTVLGSLILLYAAPSVTPWMLIALLGLLPVILTAVTCVRQRETSPVHLPGLLDVLFLAAPVVMVAFFSFSNLAYADYWGDEMNGLLRAVAAILGRPDAIFTHTKGPAEIILPAVFGLLVGQFDPFTLRFPSGLALALGVGSFYLLVRRLLDRNTALLAALLLSVNGLYLAYGRHAQYQAVVLLTTCLSLLMAYHFYRRGGSPELGLAAFLLGVGLLAHYDLLLMLPPVAYLVWQLWRRQQLLRRHLWRRVGWAAAILGVVAALFYLPYVFEPQIANTSSYLTRIIGARDWPANNFDELYLYTVLYNSVYFALVMAVLSLARILADLGRVLKQRDGRTTKWLVSAAVAVACLLMVASGLARYIPLIISGAVFLVLVTFSSLSTERKVVYVWMGTAFIAYMFLVDHPRNHLQVIFPGCSILAALATKGLIRKVRDWLPPVASRWAEAAIGVVGLALLLLFANYQYTLFVDTQSEYFLTYPEHKSSLYWEDPNFPFGSRRPYGTPHRLGWQMVNRLFLDGTLQGDWDSNDSGSNLFWYTLGWPRNPCYPRYYFAATFQQKDRDPDATSPAFSMDRYARIGQIWNRDRLQMDVYEFAPLGGARPLVVWSEPEHYDTFVTPADFRTLPYSDPLPEITTPLPEPAVFRPAPAALGLIAERYGDERITGVQDRAALTGYDLDLRWNSPGGVVVVTLYWQALDTVNLPYKVFVHLEDGTGRTWAQADDFPACGTRTTRSWRTGQVVTDRHVVALPADIPPGEYALQVGLYEPQTEQRMDWLDALGNPQGTAYRLAAVSVGPASTQPAPDCPLVTAGLESDRYEAGRVGSQQAPVNVTAQ